MTRPPLQFVPGVAGRLRDRWCILIGRALSSSEEYAVAKMRLFRAFDEGAKEPHLGYCVFLTARKRAPVQFCPRVQGRLRDENFEGERRSPVNRNDVGEFATGFTLP